MKRSLAYVAIVSCDEDHGIVGDTSSEGTGARVENTLALGSGWWSEPSVQTIGSIVDVLRILLSPFLVLIVVLCLR